MEFDHLGIVVLNSGFIVEALRSYGLSISRKFFDEDENVNTIEMGPIHILEPLSLDSPINSFIEKNKTVLHHIALKTSNLEDFKKTLEDPIMHEGENNEYKYFFVLKSLPNNKKILIEFIEIKEAKNNEE